MYDPMIWGALSEAAARLSDVVGVLLVRLGVADEDVKAGSQESLEGLLVDPEAGSPVPPAG
jgi:hypothetical protein